MSRPFARRSGFNRIGGVLNDSLDSLGLRKKILEQQAMDRWAEVTGAQIAAASTPEKVRDGILFVACKSSMWANELSLHKTDIVKKLNKAVGKAVINDIRFGARGFKRAAEQARNEDSRIGTKKLEAIEVEEDDLKAASKAASAARDSELAKVIERAIITSKRLSRAKLGEGWRRCPNCGVVHKGGVDVCEDCR